MKDFSVYYFGQHLYTLVPRHLDADMEWMAQHGAKNVCVGVREADIDSPRRRNLRHICTAAKKHGLDVLAVPTHWGNINAGVTNVHSRFAWTHPELWMRAQNGAPVQTGFGPILSVHYPETFNFIMENAQRLLNEYPISGLIWDEPKMLHLDDYCDGARKVMPAGADRAWQIDQAAGFYSRVLTTLKASHPACAQWLFIEANQTWALEAFASLDGLDVFGVDGKPVHFDDSGLEIRAHKPLLPNSRPFLDAARRNNKETMLLLENHDFPVASHPLWEKRMDELADLNPDHWIYYYYPRDLEDPEANMRMVEQFIGVARTRSDS